jgi:hypothetical protein
LTKSLPPSSEPTCGFWSTNDLDQKLDRFRKPGDIGFRFEVNLKWDPFARTLAKTAHALAVAEFGIDSFVPFLPKIVLGTDKNIAYVVGGVAPPRHIFSPPPNWKQDPHRLSMRLLKSVKGKPTLLVAYIQLFPLIGAPTYQVIVGEAGPAVLELLE